VKATVLRSMGLRFSASRANAASTAGDVFTAEKSESLSAFGATPIAASRPRSAAEASARPRRASAQARL
jgi:hypothetical protein